MAAEFDRYGGTYEEAIAESIGFSGREHAFFLEAKVMRLLDLVRRRLGDPAQVCALDVGCGPGTMHPYLTGAIGQLEGADLSESMIADARRLNPGTTYHVADARSLPSPDDAFDLVTAICILHHVAAADRDRVVAELARVTRPGGLVVVFEHNPLNPLTRLAVARCQFDEDAVLMGRHEAERRLHAAGMRAVESRYFLFLPWAGRVVRVIERTLGRVPLGAQYYTAARA
jgi:ubiquinone/menaquinone biosynthesis C-methylase UbiE